VREEAIRALRNVSIPRSDEIASASAFIQQAGDHRSAAHRLDRFHLARAFLIPSVR
jgi:hypothetical protein